VIWGKKKKKEERRGTPMNFAIQGFEDLTDTTKLVKIANAVVEKYNEDDLARGDYLTLTFGDDRKYKAGIDPSKKLIFIQRVE